MTKIMDEGHICLLDNYSTALQVTRSFEDLDDILCGLLADFIESWVQKELGDEWKGEYDLREPDQIWFAKKSWSEGEGDDEEDLVWFALTIDGPSDETWTTHLLGFAEEPFKAYVVLDGVAEKVGKEEAIRLAAPLAARLKGAYSQVAKKKILKYTATVQLDAKELSQALPEEDLPRAFAPIEERLEEFRSLVEEIDKLVDSLLGE